jgi:hypothetical protein
MEIAPHWRLKAQRYRLEGSACPVCRRVAFPPRPVCFLAGATIESGPQSAPDKTRRLRNAGFSAASLPEEIPMYLER